MGMYSVFFLTKIIRISLFTLIIEGGDDGIGYNNYGNSYQQPNYPQQQYHNSQQWNNYNYNNNNPQSNQMWDQYSQ